MCEHSPHILYIQKSVRVRWHLTFVRWAVVHLLLACWKSKATTSRRHISILFLLTQSLTTTLFTYAKRVAYHSAAFSLFIHKGARTYIKHLAFIIIGFCGLWNFGPHVCTLYSKYKSKLTDSSPRKGTKNASGYLKNQRNLLQRTFY